MKCEYLAEYSTYRARSSIKWFGKTSRIIWLCTEGNKEKEEPMRTERCLIVRHMLQLVASADKKDLKTFFSFFLLSVHNSITLLIFPNNLILDRARYVEYSARYSHFNYFNYFFKIIFACLNFPEIDNNFFESARTSLTLC